MSRLVQFVLTLLRRLLRGRAEPSPAFEPKDPPAEADEESTAPVEEGEEDDEDEPTESPESGPSEEIPMSRLNLTRGSLDKDSVRELQALLNKQGERLTVDGDFGPGTEKAVKGYQKSYDLPEDGVVSTAVWILLEKTPYGSDAPFQDAPMPAEQGVLSSSGVAKSWNAYGNLLRLLGVDLDIDPAVACAVLAVESAGEGFWGDRMVIRFENHIFHRYWGKDHQGAFDEHFSMNPSQRWKDHKWRDDPSEPWSELHTKAAGQDAEWAVLGLARTLNDTAALNSISMGAPQIMGFNSAKVGFDTVQDMFKAFSNSERAHVLGLFDFIRSNHKMVRALRSGDWRGFAYIYNGSGQADYYGGKVGEHVEAAKRLGIP